MDLVVYFFAVNLYCSGSFKSQTDFIATNVYNLYTDSSRCLDSTNIFASFLVRLFLESQDLVFDAFLNFLEESLMAVITKKTLPYSLAEY
jgi:hypothetical protein